MDKIRVVIDMQNKDYREKGWEGTPLELRNTWVEEIVKVLWELVFYLDIPFQVGYIPFDGGCVIKHINSGSNTHLDVLVVTLEDGTEESYMEEVTLPETVEQNGTEKIFIEINWENEEFEELFEVEFEEFTWPIEIVRIFCELCHNLEDGTYPNVLFDLNGNRVGTVEYKNFSNK